LSSDNPFRVLGIPIELAVSLTPEQLKAHAKNIYKALQKIFHPDKGGDNEIALKITQAMEDIEDPAIFMTSWQEYVSNPDPEAAEIREQIRNMKIKLSSLERKNDDMSAENAGLRRKVLDLTGDLKSLREISMIRFEEILKDNERFDGIEVEYSPLGTIGERRKAHIRRNSMFTINQMTGHISLGKVIGSIRREDIYNFIDGKQKSKIFEPIKGELSAHLRPNLEVGSVLLSLRGGRVYFMGEIKEVKRSHILEVRGSRVKAEAYRRYKMFVEREFTGRKFPMGFSNCYFPDTYTGIIILESEEGKKPLVVKEGRLTKRRGISGWSQGKRLIGSIDELNAERLAAIRREDNDDEKVFQKEFFRFLREGGFNPIIKNGEVLLLSNSNGLPIIAGIIVECRYVSGKPLDAMTCGEMTLISDGRARENLLLQRDNILLEKGKKRFKVGRFIGSEVEVEETKVSVPWIERGGKPLVHTDILNGGRRLKCDKISSFRALTPKMMEKKLKPRKPRKRKQKA